MTVPPKFMEPLHSQPSDIDGSQGRPRPALWTGQGGRTLDLHGHLKGAAVFIVASGPSFSSLDHELLKQPGCLTMGLNNSPKTFRPDWWISVDDPSHFLHSIWLDPKIMKFVRSKHRRSRLLDSESRVLLETTAEECPNAVFYESDLDFQASNFLVSDRVSWGNKDSEGGGRSVLLAALKTLYHLGAGHVFLLGVDFQMSENYAYHFPQQRSKSSIEGNTKTYHILANRFETLQALFEAADFHVWNCNLQSELKAFPFLPFEDAVTFATENMSAKNGEESSSGLYDRVQGRNDSAEALAPMQTENSEVPALRRIDRNKRPKILKSEDLDSTPLLPEKNAGLLLFVDEKLEWMLPWWFHHFEQSNPGFRNRDR